MICLALSPRAPGTTPDLVKVSLALLRDILEQDLGLQERHAVLKQEVEETIEIKDAKRLANAGTLYLIRSPSSLTALHAVQTEELHCLDYLHGAQVASSTSLPRTNSTRTQARGRRTEAFIFFSLCYWKCAPRGKGMGPQALCSGHISDTHSFDGCTGRVLHTPATQRAKHKPSFFPLTFHQLQQPHQIQLTLTTPSESLDRLYLFLTLRNSPGYPSMPIVSTENTDASSCLRLFQSLSTAQHQHVHHSHILVPSPRMSSPLLTGLTATTLVLHSMRRLFQSFPPSVLFQHVSSGFSMCHSRPCRSPCSRLALS